MKMLLLVLSAAGLTGCAVYPVPAYDTYGGGPEPVYAPVYVAPPPVVFYGGGVYRSGGVPHAYPRAQHRPHPRAVPLPPPHPRAHAPRRGHGGRDRDGDGVPNRLDRDRDGDGVRNRHDRRPGNPDRR